MTDLEMADDTILTETLEVMADVKVEDQGSGTVTEDDLLVEIFQVVVNQKATISHD